MRDAAAITVRSAAACAFDDTADALGLILQRSVDLYTQFAELRLQIFFDILDLCFQRVQSLLCTPGAVCSSI